MKKANILLIATLFAMAGCSSDKQAADNLITVDVTANYPETRAPAEHPGGIPP